MICICGYTSAKPVTVKRHQKTCKKFLVDEAIRDSAQHLIRTLKEQLAAKDEHYQKEFAAKDEILKLLIQNSNDVLRKSQAARNGRTKMPEPKRRKIAARQNWKCANPDGNCTLRGELQEYDVDHIIPLMKDGLDNESNMQALCPACHRRKTDKERCDQVGASIGGEDGSAIERAKCAHS